MDDKDIIVLYNLRDENAISETDKKYGKYCFSIAQNILDDIETSKECVSDTYLKTWNSIPPKAPSSLRLFLAKIVRNLAFDRYRYFTSQKRGGKEITVTLEEIKDFLPAENRVETQLEEVEFMRQINRFLSKLSQRDRCIFINRYFHIEPTNVLANKYGTSENNVHKILSRTRTKLKKFLETEGYTI